MVTIPTSQLETWSRYVEAPQSKRTADLIKMELERVDTRIGASDFRVYLQGSYKNHTNIFRDSDVDIVVELKDIFYNGEDRLTTPEKELRRRSYSSSTVSLSGFRQQVFQQLVDRFGQHMVEDGNKAIKVGGLGDRLNADVLVCAEYRNWEWFTGTAPSQHSFAPGITFWTQDDRRQVINFPQVHYDNGVSKQENSKRWFKPTVRMVKNARRLMYSRGMLQEGTAPSYFVQGLLYNVPNYMFGNTHQQNYQDVVRWLSDADLMMFTCQHEQHPLFGPSPEQWDIGSATRLIQSLQTLWDTWR